MLTNYFELKDTPSQCPFRYAAQRQLHVAWSYDPEMEYSLTHEIKDLSLLGQTMTVLMEYDSFFVLDFLPPLTVVIRVKQAGAVVRSGRGVSTPLGGMGNVYELDDDRFANAPAEGTVYYGDVLDLAAAVVGDHLRATLPAEAAAQAGPCVVYEFGMSDTEGVPPSAAE